jgi:hypothetical protein
MKQQMLNHQFLFYLLVRSNKCLSTTGGGAGSSATNANASNFFDSKLVATNAYSSNFWSKCWFQQQVLITQISLVIKLGKAINAYQSNFMGYQAGYQGAYDSNFGYQAGSNAMGALTQISLVIKLVSNATDAVNQIS